MAMVAGAISLPAKATHFTGEGPILAGDRAKEVTMIPPHQNRNILIVTFSIMIALVAGAGYLVWSYLIRPIVRAKRAEANKLNAILTSIADGVIVQNLAGEIEQMNPSARRTIEDTVGSVFSAQKVDEQTRQAQNEARLSSLMSFLTNLHFYQTEGFEIGQRVLSAHAAPIISSEEKIGSVVILRDVTREAESIRLKDDFLTTISHELRTPLSVIKNYVDLLRMKKNGVVSGQQAIFLRNLDNVDEQIDVLLNLIEQMLDLTQVNAGALGIDLERVNLLEIIRTEANCWREKMADRNLAYAIHLSDEAVWVEGDQNRLGRVVHNLLKNAHHYTLPGGAVEISMQRRPKQVQVDVRDTGVGIADRDKPLIFSRFFRAIHAEETFEVGGAGLGLFLSRAIIEAHGGQIWFESEPDQGSIFSFTLPAVL